MPRRRKASPEGLEGQLYDPDLGPDYDNLDPDFDTDTEDPMQREHDKQMARMMKALDKKEKAALKVPQAFAPVVAPSAPSQASDEEAALPGESEEDRMDRLYGRERHWSDRYKQMALRRKAAGEG